MTIQVASAGNGTFHKPWSVLDHRRLRYDAAGDDDDVETGQALAVMTKLHDSPRPGWQTEVELAYAA
jgi:hypothetical protein